MSGLRNRELGPGWVAILAVGLLMGGLLVGYEPIGGDPDRIFRPIKAELARGLREGRLPYWSERLGLGVPLVAESHVGAFYPPNWLLYRFLAVPTAYRVSMWLHLVGLAAATFAYSRQIGLGPWGGALAALAFPFCGFLTIHSSHEWAYQTMPYLPLCLLAADRYATSGRLGWLASLAMLWGGQITVGHFQVQMWTGGLALLTGAWRVVADRRPLWRIVGLILGLGWGGAVAAVQLVPTWELAQLVGQTQRSFAELAYYAYPPGHWAEIAIPSLFRRLIHGPEAPYWFTQQTTGYEACLFMGTVPLILAAVGFIGGGRGLTPWRWIVPASFALATMPRWWPSGYHLVLQLPGLGYFRCPARYTAVTSFGLVLLAGRGLDRAVSLSRFRAGLTLGAAIGVLAIVWSLVWESEHPDFRAELGGDAGLAVRIGLAVLTWGLAFGCLIVWKKNVTGAAWLPLLLTAAEIGTIYHLTGTTRWGWSVPLPEASPVLTLLAGEPGAGSSRVGGVLDNLPIRAGLATATPYTGFPLLPPHPLLKAAQDRRNVDDPTATRWLRRYGVTHLVWDASLAEGAGDVIFLGRDPALDRLAYRPPGRPERREWRILRLPRVFPEVRVAVRSFSAPDLATLVDTLSGRDALDEAWFLPGESPPEPQSSRARSARVVRWQGLSGEVEHDGDCDVVLTQAYYPGWLARINEGPQTPVTRADGGLIAVRLDGAGIDHISLRFRPNGFTGSVVVSALATAMALGCLFLGFTKGIKPGLSEKPREAMGEVPSKS